MKLETTERCMRKLVPEDGKFLTNGETVAEGEVWLGILDSPDRWREITAAEKVEMEAEAEKNPRDGFAFRRRLNRVKRKKGSGRFFVKAGPHLNRQTNTFNPDPAGGSAPGKPESLAFVYSFQKTNSGNKNMNYLSITHVD